MNIHHMGSLLKKNEIKFDQLPDFRQAEILQLLNLNNFKAAKELYHSAQTEIYRHQAQSKTHR